MPAYSRLSLYILCMFVLSACSSRSAQELIGIQANKTYPDMYLRGVFNWWEADPAYKLAQVSATKYELTIELIADGQPYDFKVADGQWRAEYNCGLPQMDQLIEIGSKVELVCQQNSLNIQFIPDATAMFLIQFDTSGYSPTLRIKKI